MAGDFPQGRAPTPEKVSTSLALEDVMTTDFALWNAVVSTVTLLVVAGTAFAALQQIRQLRAQTTLSYIKHGLLDERVMMDVASSSTNTSWHALQPVIERMRRTRGGAHAYGSPIEKPASETSPAPS
jgi:hypothetical protein